MHVVHLKKGKDRRVRRGHPWVFSNEIAGWGDGTPDPGDVVEVRDTKNRFIGRGTCSPQSLIAVRLLTRLKKEEVDADLVRARIRDAAAARADCLDDGTDAARLVNGEGDGLPGVIVDDYRDTLSIQLLTHGAERFREVILDTLAALKPVAIVDRRDARGRALEGLETKGTGVIRGELPESVEIRQDGLRFEVDPVHGQKTGFFLDQRGLRQRLKDLAPGRRVLDAFCYTGATMVYALAAGASDAVGIDSSQPALEAAERNLGRNHLPECDLVQGDAFEVLQVLHQEEKQFDLVLLDPPPFAPSRKTKPQAMIAHTRLHKLALRLLVPGGVLVSSSCSHHIDGRELGETAAHAALQAGRTIRLIERGRAFRDHPAVPGMAESEYLDTLFMQA